MNETLESVCTEYYNQKRLLKEAKMRKEIAEMAPKHPKEMAFLTFLVLIIFLMIVLAIHKRQKRAQIAARRIISRGTEHPFPDLSPAATYNTHEFQRRVMHSPRLPLWRQVHEQNMYFITESGEVKTESITSKYCPRLRKHLMTISTSNKVIHQDLKSIRNESGLEVCQMCTHILQNELPPSYSSLAIS